MKSLRFLRLARTATLAVTLGYSREKPEGENEKREKYE